ncbi:hypothetical protein HK099_006451 [Clydaea vesicula]|uniref:Major facilitator superfamily (MFS) profile domain-containing protein n=1 Tax=Clydaea vesicula TaxID=447962 RepID=A0AAD5TY69_9FUNG|nr:hypothetical protein HK099_006451 [Clydaea vesicula]
MKDFGLTFGIKFIDTNDTLISTVRAPDIKGNITGYFLAGCAIGALCVSVLADILGRKRSILVGAILFSAAGLGQALSPPVIEVFYTARFISGIGIGILSMVVPLYICETAPTAVRGRMIAVQQLMITIGIFFAAVINVCIRAMQNGSELEWRLSLGMQVIPGVVLTVITFFVPYSPRWLEDHGRHEESISTLAVIRSSKVTSPAIIAEYTEIKEGVLYERSVGNASFKELLRPGILNRVLIGLALQFFQQWTGTFPGMYLIERIGRRKLLIYGGYIMGFCQFLICFSSMFAKNQENIFSYMAIIFVYIFILAFSSTWGPTVWVYQSEIFPQRIRAKGTGITTFMNWTQNAVIAKISPLIINSIDSYTFLIFGGTGVLMACFCTFLIPETMGRSLEEMDGLFGRSTPHDIALKPFNVERNNATVTNNDTSIQPDLNQDYEDIAGLQKAVEHEEIQNFGKKGILRKSKINKSHQKNFQDTDKMLNKMSKLNDEGNFFKRKVKNKKRSDFLESRTKKKVKLSQE